MVAYMREDLKVRIANFEDIDISGDGYYRNPSSTCFMAATVAGGASTSMFRRA